MEADEFKTRLLQLIDEMDASLQRMRVANFSDIDESKEVFADRIVWMAIRENCCYTCALREIATLNAIAAPYAFNHLLTMATRHVTAHNDTAVARFVLRLEELTRAANPSVPLVIVWRSVGKCSLDLGLELLKAGTKDVDWDTVELPRIVLTEVTDSPIPPPVSSGLH